MEEKYLTLVSKALEILKITIPKEEKDLKTILRVLKKSASGPIMSQSEISIHDQVRKLIKAIELGKTPEEIIHILERLKGKTRYQDYWE